MQEEKRLLGWKGKINCFARVCKDGPPEKSLSVNRSIEESAYFFEYIFTFSCAIRGT